MLRWTLACLFFSSAAYSLTLEEKVGQLLIAHFNGETANEEATILVRDVAIGGIIYYKWANGLTGPEQVQQLSNALQELAHTPLFIAVDQEGGRVTRLDSGFTRFPSNGDLGKVNDPHRTEQNAYAMGMEMAAVGINVDFAPVVDIACNPLNPVIGDRSYGSTKEIVTQHARSALNGLHRAHIIATLKHFPGHGDVSADSHVSLPVLRKSKEELSDMELYPFTHLIHDADMVMTGHILAAALDPEHCATFSHKILEGVLRREMGFNGVIISDSLIMEGLNCPSIEEAALTAFKAGCDILLLGGRQLVGPSVGRELTIEDVKKVHCALIEAVRKGEIAEERVDTSVQRILALKEKYQLFSAH